MLLNVTPEALKGPEAVPAGMYRGVVSGAKAGTSRNDNPKIDVEFTITSEGPNGEQTKGRKVFTTMTLTVEAIGVVNSTYKGITGSDLPTGEISVDELTALITSNIMNKEVMLQIEVKPHMSDPSRIMNNVKKVQQAD